MFGSEVRLSSIRPASARSAGWLRNNLAYALSDKEARSGGPSRKLVTRGTRQLQILIFNSDLFGPSSPSQ